LFRVLMPIVTERKIDLFLQGLRCNRLITRKKPYSLEQRLVSKVVLYTVNWPH
jgi:uncharacterized C2H2 Zn-finger protein